MCVTKMLVPFGDTESSAYINDYKVEVVFKTSFLFPISCNKVPWVPLSTNHIYWFSYHKLGDVSSHPHPPKHLCQAQTEL